MNEVRTSKPGVRTPIFIGGQRRSGTTLMWASLSRHPAIAGLPECHFFQHVSFRTFFKELRADHADLFERLGVDGPEMDQSVAAFIERMFRPKTHREGAQRWLEKSPENIRRIDYLFRLFPDARFIHMIRDPRDTLASMKQQAATHKPYWDKFTAEVTAPEWVKCIECGKRWRDRPQRYMEVQYEHLVTNPEPILRKVLAFLGEEWGPALLDPSSGADEGKAGNEHGRIFRTSVERWTRDLSPDEIRCLDTVAGETMTHLGYHLQMP